MKKLLLLPFILLFIFIISCQEKKIKLAADFSIRDNYLYHVECNSSVVLDKVNSKSDTLKFKTLSLFELSNFKNNLADSTFSINLKYKRLQMEQVYFIGVVNYDSKVPTLDDLTSQILNDLIDKTFQIKFDSDRSIKEIISNKIFDSISLKYQNKFKPETIEKVVDEIKESFGHAIIKMQLENLFSIYPDQKIQKNDKWVKFSKFNPTDCNFNIKKTYTFVDSRNNELFIDANIVSLELPNILKANFHFSYAHPLEGKVS